MQLPRKVRDRIEHLTGEVSLRSLRAAAERLSYAYREEDGASALTSDEARLAYLHIRFPATYSACSAALSRVVQSVPGFSPKTMLDLGSGPGTAIFSALERFPSIAEVLAIERDREMAAMADDILLALSPVVVRRRNEDLLYADLTPSDLVVAAYCLGELPASSRASLIDRAWTATSGLLLVLEPGTPEGYARILQVRDRLLAREAQIVAPCPHAQRCPMQGTRDWCHFAARVERTSLHRQLKSGSLGHEDEKFSYVAFSRNRALLPEARIVRHPLYRPGHINLQLCVDGDRIREKTVARSQKDEYRAARKARWGDPWSATYTGSDEK